MKAKLELEDGIYLRNRLGISWETWNEMMFNIGCDFTQKWFPNNWLKVCEASNFWDLWTMHFVRDDILIKNRLLHMVDTALRYKNMKQAMIHDRTLFDNIQQHLTYKTKT